MKYLAMTAAALFLLAAPSASFAQSNSNSSGGSGANSGGATQSGGNNGGATQSGGNNNATTTTQGAGGNNDTTASTSAAGSKNNCNDETPTSNYDSFSDKCRNDIDAWIGKASGKNVHYAGELAVGGVVPKDVEIIEVPTYHRYGYVMLNDRRVLVDRDKRTIIRVY